MSNKRFLTIACLAIVAALLTSGGPVIIQAGPDARATAGPAAQPADRQVLYDGLSSPSGVGILSTQLYSQTAGVVDDRNVCSQEFEADYSEFDRWAADDFIIAGYGWSIDTVEVKGTYTEYSGTESVNVFFYANSGVLPGVQMFAQTVEANAIGGVDTGDFAVPLNPPAVLIPGTYWVSVQAQKIYGGATGGQWWWKTRSYQHALQMPTFINPGGVVGNTSCTNWHTVNDCGLTPDPYSDMAFSLSGALLDKLVYLPLVMR